MATTPFIATALLAVPVVDIDNTVFIQGGIYLLLIVILNPLLFKPWLEAQKRRHDAIDGAFDKAKKLRSDADSLGAEYDEKLSAARDRALEMRSKVTREEEGKQAEKLAGVRDEAAKTLEANRKKVAEEATAAREALSGRVDELAGQITNKILGRAS
jgi:F-type H+-transporting ATPase subunit b